MITRTLLRPFALACLALAILAAGDAEGRATVQASGNRVFEKVVVLSEDVTGIVVEIRQGTGTAQLPFRRGEYTITYDPPQGPGAPEWYGAVTRQETGKPDAATWYERAGAGLREGYWAKEALIRGATLFLAQKNPDQAIALAGRIEANWPNSLRQVEARSLRGQALLQKNDIAGAKALYTDLMAKEREWGMPAALGGVRGLAAVARAEGKPGDTAASALNILNRVPPRADPVLWGPLALETARDLIDGKKTDEAMALVRRAALAEIASGHQAQARLLWGQLLAARGDGRSLIEAVDHFAIARCLPGSAVAAEASAAGRAAALKVADDSTLAQDLRNEYRALSGKF